MSAKESGSFVEFLIAISKNEDLKKIVSKGYSYLREKYLDTNNDGVFDESDYEILLKRSKMIVSLMGLAVYSDGEVQESEVEATNELIYEIITGVDGMLSTDALLAINKSYDDLMTELNEVFHNPYSMEEIAQYALAEGVAPEFFEFACIMVSADNVLYESEFQFIQQFAQQLKLSDDESKRIREKYNLLPENISKDKGAGGLFRKVKKLH